MLLFIPKPLLPDKDRRLIGNLTPANPLASFAVCLVPYSDLLQFGRRRKLGTTHKQDGTRKDEHHTDL